MIGKENAKIVFQHSPCVSSTGWKRADKPFFFITKISIIF